MIDHRQYRALLDLFMCSDPWPVKTSGGAIDPVNHVRVKTLMDEEAWERGFNNWVEAYHALPRK